MEIEEIFVFMLAVAGTAVTWSRWYWGLARATRIGPGSISRGVLSLLPLACALLLFGILRQFASHDVRDDIVYLAFYMVLGFAWVGAALWLVRLLGLHPKGDAVDRRNPAAAAAVAGAAIGITLCYAGANIGDGPGWWVVLFSGALATASWFGLWAITGRLTDMADAITIDRDLASGIRLGGFLVAAGLVLGRSAAGDWVSGLDTTADFAAIAWPAALLVLPQAALQRLFQPTPEHPSYNAVAAGALPAICYIAIAALYLMAVGWW
jgi:hypothetical protein